MLALVISLPISTAALIVAGINTRRVTGGPGLPWVLEADWQQAVPEDDNRQPHDPLSSCFWPAAAPLAELIAELAIQADFLEIGCGTGLLSLTAAMHGHSVLATDVSQTALEFTAAAAKAQSLSGVRTQIFDAMKLAEPLPRAECLLLSDILVTDQLATQGPGRSVGYSCHVINPTCNLSGVSLRPAVSGTPPRSYLGSSLI